jgi:hypothetical protein
MLERTALIGFVAVSDVDRARQFYGDRGHGSAALGPAGYVGQVRARRLRDRLHRRCRRAPQGPCPWRLQRVSVRSRRDTAACPRPRGGAQLKCATDKCEDARVTITTQLYSDNMLPQSLTWQALSFLRCEWPFLFAGSGRLRTRPFGGPGTTHVVRADGEVLLSYAEVLRIGASRAGEPTRVLGLSNVFTFPPYRGEGHASGIMRAVAGLMNDSDAELAILFCEKELAPFYAARGWQVVPANSIQAPGTAPWTMACPGPALGTGLDAWLTAEPLVLEARW